MNIYQLSFGNIKHFVAAKDDQEAYEQGTDPEKFPDLHFRPFEITLVQVEGYTITATQDKPEKDAEAPRRGRRKAAS